MIGRDRDRVVVVIEVIEELADYLIVRSAKGETASFRRADQIHDFPIGPAVHITFL